MVRRNTCATMLVAGMMLPALLLLSFSASAGRGFLVSVDAAPTPGDIAIGALPSIVPEPPLDTVKQNAVPVQGTPQPPQPNNLVPTTAAPGVSDTATTAPPANGAIPIVAASNMPGNQSKQSNSIPIAPVQLGKGSSPPDTQGMGKTVTSFLPSQLQSVVDPNLMSSSDNSTTADRRKKAILTQALPYAAAAIAGLATGGVTTGLLEATTAGTAGIAGMAAGGAVGGAVFNRTYVDLNREMRVLTDPEQNLVDLRDIPDRNGTMTETQKVEAERKADQARSFSQKVKDILPSALSGAAGAAVGGVVGNIVGGAVSKAVAPAGVKDAVRTGLGTVTGAGATSVVGKTVAPLSVNQAVGTSAGAATKAAHSTASEAAAVGLGTVAGAGTTAAVFKVLAPPNIEQSVGAGVGAVAGAGTADVVATQQNGKVAGTAGAVANANQPATQ